MKRARVAVDRLQVTRHAVKRVWRMDSSATHSAGHSNGNGMLRARCAIYNGAFPQVFADYTMLGNTRDAPVSAASGR